MLIPLRVDVPMSRRPWANYALMGLIIWVSITGFNDFDLFCKLAGVEWEYLGEGVLGPDVRITLTTAHNPLPAVAVTSSLLHVGWLHLVANMLFMWVFGNAVNYKFGHLGYLALYLAAAIAGGMAHYEIRGTPAVGASGAIYGVIGAFVVFFPRNDLSVLWIIYFRPGFARVSSMWPIMFWVAWDLFFLWLKVPLRVAMWGHIGGFCAGLSIGLVCALLGWIKPTQDEQTLLQVIGVHR